MRIGSLCSGYEGLGLAVQSLVPDAELAWVSDVDKGANKILAHRYPDVPNLGDFTVMDWSTVEPIDMLTAGYPCQPFSHAGKREGTNDARHLWPEVLRCLTELRPRFALFENVRGHLSLGFDQVLADLATHDYDARWIVLRAADIGAPHGRARLFILASDARRGGDRWDLVGAGRGAVRVGGVRGEDPDRGRDAGGADLLLLSTPQSRDHKGVPSDGFNQANLCRDVANLLPTPTARDGKDGQVRREPHRPDDVDTLSRALTDVPCAQNWITTDDGWNLPDSLKGLTGSGPLLPTPAVNDMGAAYTPEEWDAWTDRMKAEHGNGNGHGKSLSIEAQRLLPTPRAVEPGRTSEGYGLSLNGRNQAWGDYAPAIHRWEQILGRPAPAPTMTSAKGNPQLSPRFVEWMQGLPEGWVDDVPDLTRNEKLKALGNGVVSAQAVEAVRRMLALGVPQ